MQRTKRRHISSRASVSTNASRRPRRSRTSSAGGDCAVVSVRSKMIEPSNVKLKLRSGKVNSILKHSKKPPKTAKSQGPKLTSLQNCVVLAPFYTLRRGFQNKLIDLYSKEKIKKLNNKLKIAKNQNISFEYDVVEFQSMGKNKKKNKPRKRSTIRSTGKKKNSSALRSISYCKCDEIMPLDETEDILDVEGSKRTIRTKIMDSTPVQESSFSNFPYTVPLYTEINNKRRKVENPTTKISLHPGSSDFKSKGNCLLEEPTTSISNISSKIDSWDTLSDSLSYREEHLEGSLAISTTSFDSCLEQIDVTSDSQRSKTRKSKYKNRFKVVNEVVSRKTEILPGFSLKSRGDESRHLIMSIDAKSSEDRITDFMDRNPQPRSVDRTSTPQNLQPLTRVSRTKGKKYSAECAASKNYYLRSNKDDMQTPSTRENFLNSNLSCSTLDIHDGRNLASTSRKTLSSNTTRHTTQVPCETINLVENKTETKRKETASNITNKTDENTTAEQKTDKRTHLLYITPKKGLEESFSQTEELFDPIIKTPTQPDLTEKLSTPTSNENKLQNNRLSKTQGQILEKRNSGAVNNEQNSRCDNQAESERKPEESISKSKSIGNENSWCKKTAQLSLGNHDAVEEIITEPLPQVTKEVGKLPESSGADEIIQQPHDNESSFIFGSRNTSVGLEDSCKFTFGLNWVFSDEEDSEHGDRFI